MAKTSLILAMLATFLALTVAILRGSVVSVYDQQTAVAKFNFLFGKIQASTTPGLWYPTVSVSNPFASLAGMFLESMGITVSLQSDEMPSDRFKLIHSVGGAASVKVNWNAKAAKFTGLFRKSDYGLIRLASASQPDEGAGKNSIDSSFVPGIGLKFLRDGVPSGNIVFLKQLTPQDSWNFFKYRISNHLPVGGLSASQKLLFAKFETAGTSFPNSKLSHTRVRLTRTQAMRSLWLRSFC